MNRPRRLVRHRLEPQRRCRAWRREQKRRCRRREPHRPESEPDEMKRFQYNEEVSMKGAVTKVASKGQTLHSAPEYASLLLPETPHCHSTVNSHSSDLHSPRH